MRKAKTREYLSDNDSSVLELRSTVLIVPKWLILVYAYAYCAYLGVLGVPLHMQTEAISVRIQK